MVTTEGDGDDLALARLHPLVEEDPALGAHLTDRFIAAVEATELSTGERNYLNGYGPVRIGAGRTPAGLRVLRFEFGNTTTIEWDGSEQDAEEIVDQIAENAAENAAGDYWIAGGGWKEWNRRQQQPE